jgi:hypothetical protein
MDYVSALENEHKKYRVGLLDLECDREKKKVYNADERIDIGLCYYFLKSWVMEEE